MEGVSSAAIEVLVQKLINVVKEEYSLIQDLDKEAQQLQRTLGMIQSYLNDAEKKSITLDAVKRWLRDLEAYAFDADNILDEISYHLLHQKVMPLAPKKNKVLSCFPSFTHIARQRNMALKIKQVNADFESKNKTAADLSLQSILMNAPPTYALHAPFETSSVTVDPIFIGRDDVESEIVDKLSQISGEEKKISILAIVGMGGMGKTTLTRKVYNHEKIKARFGSLIWVHVSEVFDPILLFKKILSTLMTSQASDHGVETTEVILKKLQEALKGKTYLLVLDDIWNEDPSKWEDFIHSIVGATSTMGNGIIMSTRNVNVALVVRPFHTHHLEGLSDEECWSIIKAKTFENGEAPSSGFVMIGRKIAERCAGLPLAANVVGGALLRCKSEQEWRSISEKWLSDDGGGENISKILKLSFDYLPSPSLKKCFAYCSIFPKGQNIKKQEVIEQWMAEGFLLQADEKKEEMESEGEKFINVLLHNSLLQAVSERDFLGNVETYCVMHDLVHDLARSCFNQDRYIYMNYDPNNPIAKKSAKCLRTLLMKTRDELSDTMFSDFECLRVLVLNNFFGIKKLANSIRKQIHLRLLDISWTSIRKLPEWIGELHHLQTLRAETPHLRKLPGTLKYLINLRHLYISSDVELPANIGRLTSLQTLTHFNVGDKKGYGIEELGSLKNLKGRLEIHNLERVHDMEEALKANIYHKPNLLELLFKWNKDREAGETNDDKGVLEGLQPHAYLKKLEIRGYKGKRFPSWTQTMAVRDDGPQQQQASSWVPLNNLIEIKINECRECEEIPMLGHLPSLKSLELGGLKKVRFINSSFNKLTKLQLVALEGLECLPDWLFYNNPNLSELEINHCPKLRELPDGLHALTSLEVLRIINCPNLKSIIGNNNIPGGGSGGEGGGGLLRRLSIQRCGELVELPRQMMESWAQSLEELELRELSSLQNLPMVIDSLAKSAARLERLVIVGVPKFMATSSSSSVESWSCGSSLTHIDIDVSMEWSRESSVSINQTVEGMLLGCRNSLTVLYLKGMIDWDWLPGSIQYLVSLERLKLKSLGIQELPQWLGNLSSLRRLNLINCNKLRRMPPGDAYKALTNLQYLYIKDCPELEVGSEWLNIPRLYIRVDDCQIKSRREEYVLFIEKHL